MMLVLNTASLQTGRIVSASFAISPRLKCQNKESSSCDTKPCAKTIDEGQHESLKFKYFAFSHCIAHGFSTDTLRAGGQCSKL